MESTLPFHRLQQETNTGTISDTNVTREIPIGVPVMVKSNQPATGTSTNTNTITDTRSGNHRHYISTYTVVRPPPTLYRTKCDLNTIPLVARNMTWSDSFYENINYDTDEIVVVFDIDRTVFDYKVVTVVLYYWLIVLCNIYFGFLFLLVSLFLLVGIISIIEIDRRSNMLRLQRTHIAITHNGMYIDEVDTPGSTNLTRRTFITFSDIQQCLSITEYSWTEGSITHKIVLLMQEPRTVRYIVGLKQQQKFIDIVNAMMVNSSPSTETVTTVPVTVAVMGEQANVETTSTTTSVHLATNKDDIAIAKIV
jgi:hypothetical protein